MIASKLEIAVFVAESAQQHSFPTRFCAQACWLCRVSHTKDVQMLAKRESLQAPQLANCRGLCDKQRHVLDVGRIVQTTWYSPTGNVVGSTFVALRFQAQPLAEVFQSVGELIVHFARLHCAAAITTFLGLEWPQIPLSQPKSPLHAGSKPPTTWRHSMAPLGAGQHRHLVSQSNGLCPELGTFTAP